jgi:hypothetical protein
VDGATALIRSGRALVHWSPMRGLLWPCLLCAAAGCDGFRSGGTGGGDGGDGGGGGAPVDPLACSVPRLVDDFEDGVVASTWTKFGTKVAEADGVLGIEPETPGVRTGIRTDVIDWSVAVITLEVAGIEKTDQTGLAFEVAAVEERVTFGLGFGGKLVAMAHVTSGDEPTTEIPFDPTAHRFWRIIVAEHDLRIAWQVSADAAQWTTLLETEWLEVMSEAPLVIFAEDGEGDAVARYERIAVCGI